MFRVFLMLVFRKFVGVTIYLFIGELNAGKTFYCLLSQKKGNKHPLSTNKNAKKQK